MLRDGVILENGEGKVTVNQYSFCELQKHLLVRYAGAAYAEASELVDGSYLAEPIADAMSACLFSHELSVLLGNEPILRRHVLGKGNPGAARGHGRLFPP